MKKKYIIALIVGIVLLILAIIFVYINKAKKAIPPNPANVLGNSAGNLYSGGLFCEKNGYVYFSNSYDNGALYRMRANESEMEKLISTQTKLINVDDHYIFYYMAGSGSGEGFGYLINMFGLSRSDLDGSNAVTLDKSKLDSLVLIGNSLVYDTDQTNPLSMRKMDITTRETSEPIDHKVKVACGNQGLLYYNEVSDSLNMKCYNPKTDQITTVYPFDVYQPIFDGSTIYYIDPHNGYALSSYSMLTGEVTVLDNDRTDMFNMSSRYIYYQTSGKNPQLKRVAIDGSSMDVIKDGVYNNISITSQYVYFQEFNNAHQTFKIQTDGSLYVQEFTLAKNAALGLMK